MHHTPSHRMASSGYALIMVMIFTSLSFMILGSALTWSSNNAELTERNNQYFNLAAAAEAATEKVLSCISRDFQTQGESLVAANASLYRGMVPTPGENPLWADFEFSDGNGNMGHTLVDNLTAWSYVELNSQFAGLRGMASTYRIISNARHWNSRYPDMVAALKQDIQIASIPVFQFAIFYSVALEINPGAPMTVTGRVHCNTNIYAQPNGCSLTYGDDVTAAGDIIHDAMPGDPSSRSSTGRFINYLKQQSSKVSSLTLPIGTNNSPEAVQAVIEIPPAGEPKNSPIGKQRYYNKADLVLVVSNSVIRATSGAFNDFGTTIPENQVTNFMRTSGAFYDKRQSKTINTTEIDVAKLKKWSETNHTLRAVLGRDLRSVYVADKRTQSATTQSGVRLVNGQTLPSLGLTVATPNPLYVKGHYNAPPGDLGTANTAHTKPASLVADAVTLLSGNWNDASSGSPLNSRIPTDTTVNAALIAGIVPTEDGYYSGGVENFPRFLEKWSGRTLTYNGSMVVMFYSKIANAPWGGTADIYSPPARNWAFDINFMDATKLPPGTPELRAIVRGDWKLIPKNTTS